MNKLQQLLKNPKCRFKTVPEMVTDYGQNYTDLIAHMDTLDVLTVMSMYAGKVIHSLLIKRVNWSSAQSKYFRYGPTESLAHVSMLTTRAFPKWSSQADILKPGMLVTVEYGVHIGNRIVPNLLRNAPGTTVRVLKVNTPCEYFLGNHNNNTAINKFGIATELVKPVTGQSVGDVEVLCWALFKNCKVVAFEISWHLRKATEVERKFYYSQQHGADLVLTGK